MKILLMARLDIDENFLVFNECNFLRGAPKMSLLTEAIFGCQTPPKNWPRPADWRHLTFLFFISYFQEIADRSFSKILCSCTLRTSTKIRSGVASLRYTTLHWTTYTRRTATATATATASTRVLIVHRENQKEIEISVSPKELRCKT